MLLAYFANKTKYNYKESIKNWKVSSLKITRGEGGGGPKKLYNKYILCELW